MAKENGLEDKVFTAIDKQIADLQKMKKAFSAVLKGEKSDEFVEAFSNMGEDVESLREAIYTWLNKTTDDLINGAGTTPPKRH